MNKKPKRTRKRGRQDYEAEFKWLSGFLSNIINTLADPLFVKDEEHRWILLNDAFCRFIGRSEQEMLGKSDYDFFPKEQADIFWQKDKEVFLSDEPVANEEPFRSASGETRLISTVKSRWIDEHGRKFLVGTIRDVTEAKKAQAEIIAAREAAERADRAKSEFLAGISHEIRTPIHGLLGMASLLEETQLDETQRDYIAALKECGDQLLALVQDVLDFSRIEAGEMPLNEEDFSIREFLSRLNMVFSLRARQSGIHYELVMSPGLPRAVRGDPARLRQVLLNLMGNAFKFTRRGERIELSVRSVPAAGAGCQHFEFLVSDTGIGVPEEKRALIFEPFRQADSSSTRRYGGVGLGLAIVSGIAQRMGGQVALLDRPGWKTSFCFALDLREADAHFAEDEDGAPEVEGAVVRRRRVLLVEDNKINQKVGQRLLEAAGCEVIVADNGEEATQLLFQSEFDLVLLDLQMPKMDGFETIRVIREKEKETGRRTPVIAMTAYTTKSDSDKCLRLGMDDYIPKPFTAAQLKAKLARYLSS